MTEFGTYFDNTIPDPVSGDPAHAIQDPLHGPAVRERLGEIPPMPLGNGLYYRAGGFYDAGTVYVDALDQPVYVVGSARSMRTTMRELYDLEEWRVTFRHGGDEALTALEARRQEQRLLGNGVAFAYRDIDVCAGGKRLKDCETATDMMTTARERAAAATNVPRPHEGEMWVTYADADMQKRCGSCALQCAVAVQTRGGSPTGIVRFANTAPLSDRVATLRLELSKLELQPTDASNLDQPTTDQ